MCAASLVHDTCMCGCSDEFEEVEKTCRELIATIEATLGESIQEYLSPN